jgi:hypothetical protein
VTGDPGLLDEQQHGVAVAIEPQLLERLDLPRTFALAPQRLARARPIAGTALFEADAQRVAVHPRDHQHLAGVVLLGDRRHQPFGVEFDLGEHALYRVGHGPCS